MGSKGSNAITNLGEIKPISLSFNSASRYTWSMLSLQMDDVSWCEFLSFSNGILLQEAFLGALFPEPGKCELCFDEIIASVLTSLLLINFYN